MKSVDTPHAALQSICVQISPPTVNITTQTYFSTSDEAGHWPEVVHVATVDPVNATGKRRKGRLSLREKD